ncbi:MAG: fused response regulator/thioredoxin-disulfide reductase, partial [Chloroflexota bacterium]|nr:fused response regulator/thioredoxin-disulfide reductase [Chloroflexota bacterium]
NESETLPMAALFAMIGAEPRTEWLDGVLQRDERGYVITSRELTAAYAASHPLCWTLERTPFPYESSLPGVFAVGDVRHESVKRVAAAVGEGAVAITGVHGYLAERAGLRVRG